MASGLGGIFDQGKQQGPAMAAPGIPAGALSGNPVASFVNTGMATGANVGANLVGALGGLAGLPQANPAMMVQQRQQEFANTLQQIQADGSVMNGQALKMAAEKQYKAGRLAPNEYLTAFAEANKLIQQDNNLLNKSVEFINKDKTVQEYRLSKSIHEQMREMARRDPNTSDDFALIQMGIKVLDPGSVVSQSEIANGRLSVIGEQALSAIGFDVNQMLNWAAYGGEKPTFTAEQKARWLKTIGSRVDAQANAAAQVYAAGRDQFIGAGGVAPVFDRATQSTFEQLTGPSFATVVQDESGGYTSGTHKKLPERMMAAKDFVFSQLKPPQRGDPGTVSMGNDFLGIDINKDSAAGWVAKNLFGMDLDGESSAAMALVPGMVDSGLKERFGDSGPWGYLMDYITGNSVTGPLNDAVKQGAREAAEPPRKKQTPEQRARQKKRAAERKLYNFRNPRGTP